MSASIPLEVGHVPHPVHVDVEPARTNRNRLTVAFRPILALPHLLLVGGPAAIWVVCSGTATDTSYDWSLGGGVLGAVAFVSALIAWFAILFTGHYPSGLRQLVVYYLHWRVRAAAYTALLRDEFPPLGDGSYPVSLNLPEEGERNRVTVAFRPLLLIPQAIVIGLLSVAWGITCIIAWFAILFTGEYPVALYRFATGMLQWTTRVEAYALLLHDEYPPFALHD